MPLFLSEQELINIICAKGAEMNHSEFKRILENCVDKYGFTCFRKNHYLQSGDLLIVINTQKSDYDNSYYVNYGFCVKTIHPDLEYPQISECDIIGRFLNTAGGKADLFQLSELDPSKLHCCFDSNMQNIIMPVIEGGISRYFEIFPHAVHSAKRTLKEYLNASDV